MREIELFVGDADDDQKKPIFFAQSEILSIHFSPLFFQSFITHENAFRKQIFYILFSEDQNKTFKNF